MLLSIGQQRMIGNPMLAYLRLVPGFIILALVLAFTVEHRRADKWHHQFDAEHAGRLADRASYVAAQDQAAFKNKEQVAHVEQQQKVISDEVSRNLADRLERLRGELRKASAAPQGVASGSGASPSSPAPSGVVGQAGVFISTEQLLSAAEAEERHDRLIDWVEQQSKVDPNR